jgi:hypothetical protein
VLIEIKRFGRDRRTRPGASRLEAQAAEAATDKSVAALPVVLALALSRAARHRVHGNNP